MPSIEKLNVGDLRVENLLCGGQMQTRTNLCYQVSKDERTNKTLDQLVNVQRKANDRSDPYVFLTEVIYVISVGGTQINVETDLDKAVDSYNEQ